MKQNKKKFVIFKPAKSPMQSGVYNTKKWCLISKKVGETYINSKFCWTGISNPEDQIILHFESLEEAERFAKKNNYHYEIIRPIKRKMLKKSYAENFIKSKY